MTATLRLLGRGRLLASLLMTAAEQHKKSGAPFDPMADLVGPIGHDMTLFLSAFVHAYRDIASPHGSYLEEDAWHVVVVGSHSDALDNLSASTVSDLGYLHAITSPGRLDQGGRSELVLEGCAPRLARLHNVAGVLLTFGNSIAEGDRIPILYVDLVTVGLAWPVGTPLTFDILSPSLLELSL